MSANAAPWPWYGVNRASVRSVEFKPESPDQLSAPARRPPRSLMGSTASGSRSLGVLSWLAPGPEGCVSADDQGGGSGMDQAWSEAELAEGSAALQALVAANASREEVLGRVRTVFGPAVDRYLRTRGYKSLGQGWRQEAGVRHQLVQATWEILEPLRDWLDLHPFHYVQGAANIAFKRWYQKTHAGALANEVPMPDRLEAGSGAAIDVDGRQHLDAAELARREEALERAFSALAPADRELIGLHELLALEYRTMYLLVTTLNLDLRGVVGLLKASKVPRPQALQLLAELARVLHPGDPNDERTPVGKFQRRTEEQFGKAMKRLRKQTYQQYQALSPSGRRPGQGDDGEES